MSLKIDRLQLEIIINNDQSRMKLRELENNMKSLKKEMKKVPEGSAEWNKMSDRLKSMQQQHDKVINSIGLHGLSLKELSQRQKELNMMMRNMDPRLPQYKELEKQYNAISKRQGELRSEMKKTGSSISKISDNFNKYFGKVTAGIASLTAVFFSFRKLIQGSAELSDKMADVRKTTGLAAEGVKELYTELKQIDTRSSRSELLDLARIAGKLGVEGKEDILGFVRAADQINVALSEDLGGDAEEAIRQVGKLVDIFKVKDTYGLESGMLRVGSAINALGAASSANEPFLIEFAKRFGGIAPNAGISVQDVLGLAATLDQLGQTSEVSTTALGKLMVNMGKDVPMFADVAGKSVEEFSKLLKEDANEALIAVLEGSKSNKKGLEGMAESLNKLGVDGSRAVGVVGVLSNNIDILRKQQELSNDEFAKGTSITDEYNIKNETLGALLDKINKKLAGLFINSSIMEGLKSLVQGFAELIGVGEKQDDILTRLKNNNGLMSLIKLLVHATATYAGYVAGLKLTALWEKIVIALKKDSVLWHKLEIIQKKANIIITNASIVVTQLYAAATMLLSRNIKGAAQAMRILKTTMAGTPWGALIAAVAALGTTIYLYSTKMDLAAKKAKLFNDVKQETITKIADEKSKIEPLLRTLADKDAADERRLAAYNELKKIAPDILKNIDFETAKITNLTLAYTNHIAQLERGKQIDLFKTQLSDLIAQEDQLNDSIKLQEQAVAEAENTYKRLQSASNSRAITGAIWSLDQESDKLDELKAELIELQSLKESVFSEIGILEEKNNAYEKQRLLDDYYASIKEHENNRRLNSKSSHQQELDAIDEYYDALYQKAVDAGIKGDDLEVIKNELEVQRKQEYDAKQLKIEEKTQQDLIKLKQSYGIDMTAELRDAEMTILQGNYKDKLLNEEEFQIAKQHIIDKYPNADEKQLAEKKRLLDDYYNAIDKHENDLWLESFTRDQQQLMAIDEKYDALYQKAVDAGIKGDELEDIQNVLDFQREQEYKAKELEIEEKTQQDLINLKQSYGIDMTAELMDAEMIILQGIYNDKLLNEEEFQIAKQHIIDKYADEETKRKKKTAITQEQIDQWQADGKMQILNATSDLTQSLFKSDSIAGRVAASAMAIINTWAAASAALAPPPLGMGPVYGVPYAIAAVASGLANVAKINSVQFASGKYDVIGATDKRTYSAGFSPKATTGIYEKPTLIGGLGLVGERAPELVVDGPTLSNIRINAPQIIEAIHYMRVPQYGSGNYPSTPYRSVAATVQPQTETRQDMYSPEIIEVLNKVLEAVQKPTRANVVYTDLKRVENEMMFVNKFIGKEW